jgi:hypothetical protein
MRSCIILVLCTFLVFCNLALAQIPHPERYQIIYGNRLGATDTIMLGAMIRVPMWGHTDPEDSVDTVATMFNPLRSANIIITERDGGEYIPFQCIWGDGSSLHFFTQPVSNGNDSTSQAFLFIGDQGTIEGPCLFWTGNDTIEIGTFLMKATEDASRTNHRYCPFAEGWDPANGSLLWGFSDGMNQVVPIASYGCLYIDSVSYIPGDGNGDWTFNALDVVYMVNYLKGMDDPPPYYYKCPRGRVYATADANGSCAFNAIDVTYCINYFKGRGPAPVKCQDCP